MAIGSEQELKMSSSTAMHENRWKFWIDVGGTFTDCFAIDLQGIEHDAKLLSSGISGAHAKLLGISNSEALLFQDLPSPILGMHLITKVPIGQLLPTSDVHLGTTRGTNALLTRSGAKTALVTSQGMQDFLAIGDQTRPHLFQLTVRKPQPLYSVAIEIAERVLNDGTVETEPCLEKVQHQLQQLRAHGVESLAVCFMHGYKYPRHEQLVGEIARDIGFRDIRLSCEVAPLIKIVLRGETTVLDAYLNPVIGDYLDRIQSLLSVDSTLRLMTSAGSLTSRAAFSGKDSVLSGPAGGVVGAARVAQQLGFQRMIGFDMGGTSTDVSRFDGQFELEFETRKAGTRIMTPIMSIETVAAGGGSICDFDGTRLTVGPRSAGADPGPACYGNGGPLTVTDINLYLGRLDRQQFPLKLDFDAVVLRLNQVAERIAEAGQKKDCVELALGFLAIANHNMAAAIKTVSVARGNDPREYALVAFGGAGGQHCCAVADILNISQILVHRKSSILSAFGIHLADQSRSQVRSVMSELTNETEQDSSAVAQEMIDQLCQRMVQEGCNGELVSEYGFDLRYSGTDKAIHVRNPIEGGFADRFQREHSKLYGYVQDRPIEIVAVRSTVTKKGRELEALSATPMHSLTLEPGYFQALYSKGRKTEAARFEWNSLESGSQIHGPAIIGDPLTSTIVDSGWQASVLANRQLLLSRVDDASPAGQSGTNQTVTEISDPIELEIFNSSFRSIAEQMGHVLRNTAISVNVKERLDFSCALFSETGDLVVNAPHIPVHLGAMSDTVRATINSGSPIRQGDVFVTNDPYDGGSHLPDVTVLTPVFDGSSDNKKPILWVASRAHHAEIGGIAPGSMPANATRLEQEGVLIRNFKLISGGQEQFGQLRECLNNALFPSRNADENIADIKAQVAANQAGVRAIKSLIARRSLPIVLAYMHHIRAAAALKTRTAIQTKIADGRYKFEDRMDDNTKIRVAIVKSDDTMKIDFSGTDAVHAGNLNANGAIVSSAVMYVLRCLIDEDIPLNGGVLEPVEINLPHCFLNPSAADNRQDSPAVVGGNVETSQRIVDVLLGALKMAAASQGTMNNWLIGDPSFGYYETVGGGGGATNIGPGESAVHCHMSNTRLTDPEILESRYPIILREFGIRCDSGGAGRQRGGDGIVREIEFCRPLTLSLLTSRRSCSAFGLQGGSSGLPGKNIFLPVDGKQKELASQCEVKVKSGDRLRLLTPGGGGFGEA